jgi:hypothetical protein
MIDSKGWNFGCLVVAKGETAWLKKKNGKAPARQTQFFTAIKYSRKY